MYNNRYHNYIIIIFCISIILSLFVTMKLLFPSDELTWLHTDGKYIKNKRGEIITLKGVAVIELNTVRPYGVSRYWGQQDGTFNGSYGHLPNSFNLLKKSDVNCIRLSINWYSWMGIDHPNSVIPINETDSYKDSVDSFVEELTKRGIYVFIDFHAFDGARSPEKWKEFIDNQLNIYWDFWEDITSRYKSNPGMMGFEIMNEPRDFYNEYPYHGYWWNFTLTTAKIIHKNNPRLIIFVPSADRTVNGTTSQFPANAGYKVIGDQFINNPIPEHNIVYVFHFHFPRYANGWDVYENYINGSYARAKELFDEWLYLTAFRALDYDLPIINSEFDVKKYDYRTAETLQYPHLKVTFDYLEIMNKYGCNWIWWAWTGSVGYPWDHSSDSNNLIYMSEKDLPIWNKFTNVGIMWKVFVK